MQAKTIVLNLSGTLLKTDFVFGKGMTMLRRPGLNKFLKSLSQKYEVIIYSDDDYMFLTTAVEYLDPRQQIFMGAFGKESMVWANGRYVKDLSYLNRDPKNIVVIEKDIKNLGKYHQNAIVLPEFKG
jgi:mitochondrial import inner membrane translocase subunit TIM50